jgi:acyl-CoA thioesterase-1
MVNCPSEVLTDFPRSCVLIIARITKFIVALYCFSASQLVIADTILVYGDSISAAYGMEKSKGWVNLLAKRIAIDRPHYKVVNASVSGETTGGGVTRLPKSLAFHQPDVLVLELGGNDGLRGYPISSIRDNLQIMIQQAKTSGAHVLLIGMVLPPNYGLRYTLAFEKIFSSLAEEHSLPFVPFLLDGVSTGKSLVQRDGIHPTVEAQPKLLDDVWPSLAPML